MFCGLTRFCPWFCWRGLRSKPSSCISSSLECGIQRYDIHDTIFSGCAILWAASVHLVNACKKNPWDKKNSFKADSLRWEWSHSRGCRHTQKKKTTLGTKTLGMVSLRYWRLCNAITSNQRLTELLWSSTKKKHAIRTKQKHTRNHQHNTCTEDDARTYMQPPTKRMQSGLHKNIHATINKTCTQDDAITYMQQPTKCMQSGLSKNIHNHQQNTYNHEYAKTYMQPSPKHMKSGLMQKIPGTMNKTHTIRTYAKTYMQPWTKHMQSGLHKNIHTTINKTDAIRTHAKTYMQPSTKQMWSGLCRNIYTTINKTHAISTYAKTWIHTNKIMEDKLSSANMQFWKLSKNEYNTFQVLVPSTWGGWICTTQLLIMPCPALKCLFFIMLTNLSSHGIFPKPSGALGLLLVLVLVLSCSLCFSHAWLVHALDRLFASDLICFRGADLSPA